MGGEAAGGGSMSGNRRKYTCTSGTEGSPLVVGFGLNFN